MSHVSLAGELYRLSCPGAAGRRLAPRRRPGTRNGRAPGTPPTGLARRPPNFRGYDLWSARILHQRLFTIADLAKHSGLDAEARALIESLRQRFGSRPDYDSIGLTRAAVIAQTLLELEK